MASSARFRTWYLVHKWTSLVCTAFLLLACVTGLPLIFADEIDAWLEGAPAAARLQPGAAAPALDDLAQIARARYPGQIVRWIVFDRRGDPVVTLAPAHEAERKLDHWVRFDARSGQLLQESLPGAQARPGSMKLVLSLHTDLFAGLAGEMFLAAIGALFVAALVSGVVLYAPFMRRLDFGTVRRDRAPRIKWLDLHNLLGIVILAWAGVVGLTGVINQMATPLFSLWRATEVAAMLAPYRGKPAPVQLSTVQGAVDTARRTLPGGSLFSIVYPEPRLGSAHHYLVWVKGGSPLTSRLFTPLLIDAQSGELTAIAHLPWYLKALEVSRPLHFGDYGGMPLKILWALLDVATIIVLGSGLYLWFARRRQALPIVDELREPESAR